MNATEIKTEVRKLSAREKYELLSDLSRDLRALSDAELEAVWVDEAQKRLEELRTGKVELVTGEVWHKRRDAAI